MAILTDLKAKIINPDDKPLAHSGVTGLSLWPAKTKGCGKWILRYVSPVTGRRRKAGLGPTLMWGLLKWRLKPMSLGLGWLMVRIR